MAGSDQKKNFEAFARTFLPYSVSPALWLKKNIDKCFLTRYVKSNLKKWQYL
jgi:hypothetical protein